MENCQQLNGLLLQAISVCNERISISKQNKDKYDKLHEQFVAGDQLLIIARNTANHMSKMYKNIKFFLENKKSASKDILEASIRSVSAIVQDSDLQSCTILHENNKTKILNESGQNINKREGSAARAIMGLILRYTCLKALPNKIQLMFLDEALASISSNTSTNLKELLDVFSKEIGIVGIEQRNFVYSGLASKRFHVTKTHGESVIREVDVDYWG